MGDEIANKVAAAIASVPTEVSNPPGNEAPKKEEPKEEKLDAQAELFVRRVTDSVTKALAELLNPSSTAKTEDEDDEIEEEGKKVRRKRKPSTPPPQPKKRNATFLDGLFGR